MTRAPGLTPLLAATGLAAVAGYLLIWLVPLQIGLEAYKDFALFWAAMYFLIGAFSGLQHEVTRGTVRRVTVGGTQPNPARNFGLAVSAFVFVAVVATAPLWVDTLFPGVGWPLVWPLAVAAASYVIVATVAGTLYGVAGWLSLALMIAIDAFLRLAAVGIVAVFTNNAVPLAWAAAIPFLLTIALLWPRIRRDVVGRTTFDAEYRTLSWNVARTMVAAASMGVLVSGFPVVLGVAAIEEPDAYVAALFLAIMVTRAPVIVVVMSLQGYLIVRFRDHRATLVRDLLGVLGIVLSGGIVLALIAWVVGPTVFALLYGGAISLDGWFYAVLVVSSALVGALSVTAPAVLSLAQHVVYSAGWVVAAFVTMACFFLPFGLVANTVAALIAGPLAGLAVHSAYLIGRSRSVSPELP